MDRWRKYLSNKIYDLEEPTADDIPVDQDEFQQQLKRAMASKTPHSRINKDADSFIHYLDRVNVVRRFMQLADMDVINFVRWLHAKPARQYVTNAFYWDFTDEGWDFWNGIHIEWIAISRADRIACKPPLPIAPQARYGYTGKGK